MAERPLLIFPEPQQANRSALGSGGGDNFTGPTHSRQGERVTLQLTRLQDAFDRRTAEVLASPDGIDPSQVIVIETVGSVSGFATAVRRIKGLEWLERYGEERFKEVLQLINDLVAQGKAKSPVGFIRRAFEENYAPALNLAEERKKVRVKQVLDEKR